MVILVTGTAGFIGYHVAKALMARGDRVIGIDNLNDYYDVALKRARLDNLTGGGDFSFHEIDIADRDAVFSLIEAEPDITHIVHLAAQAGVRYSLIDPYSYVRTNVEGYLNLLEASRKLEGLAHFVYASSSSVYGANEELPFSIEHRTDRPLSLYAATKKSSEMMAHCYSHLYRLPLTGLRFFTVYGPWGR
ncbi:MAG: SDR family NAD(P)-dependent oxidoreductase, partial [Alphaproteobacteria bacterium]